MKFSHPETAANYEPLVEVDHKVSRPLIYSGMLSKIPPAMAEAMVKAKSNLIKKKDPAPAAEPIAEQPKAEPEKEPAAAEKKAGRKVSE